MRPTAGQVVGLVAVVIALSLSAIGGPDRLLALTEGDDGCQGGGRVPEPAQLAQVRDATLCLLNRERGDHGLPPLVTDARLTVAAQQHSEDMGARNFFAHETPDGRRPADRIFAAGLPRAGSTTGENIAWGVDDSATPSQIVRGWMNSPGHRANILRRSFTHIGIGIGFDAPRIERGRAAVYTTNFAGYPAAAE